MLQNFFATFFYMLVIISCESSWQYQSFSQKSFLVFRSRCIQSKIGRLLSFSYFRLTTFIKYFNQYVVSSLAKVWHSLSLILHRAKIERKLKIAIQVAIKFLFYFLSFKPWSIYTSKECEFKFTIWPVSFIHRWGYLAKIYFTDIIIMHALLFNGYMLG